MTANIADFGLSTFDYVLTSPPYWDMLRAKGAETQKKRRSSEELDVHYSDDPNDLGNIEDYELFVGKLVEIYKGLKSLLREKAYLTIISAKLGIAEARNRERAGRAAAAWV